MISINCQKSCDSDNNSLKKYSAANRKNTVFDHRNIALLVSQNAYRDASIPPTAWGLKDIREVSVIKMFCEAKII